MKRRRVTLSGAGMVVMLTTVVQATVTITPPVRSDESDNLLCIAQNLSAQAVQIESTLHNGLNNLVDTVSFSVPAGESRTLASTTTQVCVLRRLQR